MSDKHALTPAENTFASVRREKNNVAGTKNVSNACRSIGARMVHVSTDYVSKVRTSRAAVFVAVSDPTRRAILQCLTGAETRVTELANAFPISLNSTSKHIRMLERAGFMRRRVVGRDHLLSLDAAPMAEAAQWMEPYRTFGTTDSLRSTRS